MRTRRRGAQRGEGEGGDGSSPLGCLAPPQNALAMLPDVLPDTPRRYQNICFWRFVEQLGGLMKDLAQFVDASHMTLTSPPNTRMRQHTIQFAGDERSATLRTNKILASLKIGPKKYRTFYSTGDDKVRLYVNPQKSPLHMKREFLYRKFKQAVSVHSDKTLRFDWPCCTVSIGWDGIQRLACDDANDTVEVIWAPENTKKYKLDAHTEEITKQFHKLIASRRRVPSFV